MRKYLAILFLLTIYIVSTGMVDARGTATISQVGNTIYVYGNHAWANLTDIMSAINNNSALSRDGTIFLANDNIYVNGTTTSLYINDTDATWLKLNSTDQNFYSYLKINGYLDLNNTKITSWNTTTNAPVNDPSLNRSYIDITGSGNGINISNSEISYLGYWKSNNYHTYGLFIDTKLSTQYITNVIFNNNYMGIRSRLSNLLVNNSIFRNNSLGIILDSSNNDAYLTNLGVYDSNSYGIEIVGTFNSLILSNSIINNSQKHNIFLLNAVNIKVDNNNIGYSGNPWDNIHLENTSYSNISNNVIHHPYRAGILLTDINNDPTGTDGSSNNILTNNVITDSFTDDGLIFQYYSNNNIASNNTIENNNGYGIYFGANTKNNSAINNYVDDTNYPITNNSSLGKFDFGISQPMNNSLLIDNRYNSSFGNLFYMMFWQEPTNVSVIYNDNRIFDIRNYTNISGIGNVTFYPTYVMGNASRPKNTKYPDSITKIVFFNGSLVPLSDLVIMNVSVWNTTQVQFSESSPNASVQVKYVIGDRIPNQNYSVKIFWNNGTQFQDLELQANNTGYLNYDTIAGFDNPRYQVITLTSNSSPNTSVMIMAVIVIIGGLAFILNRFMKIITTKNKINNITAKSLEND